MPGIPMQKKPMKTKAVARYKRYPQAGFSLIEMAMVLLILGILMSGLLVAVGNTTENTRRTQTNAQLEQIELALYGFAQATGRLPCPATSTSDGYEAPVGGGDCTAQHGFIPAVTLNLRGAVNDDGLLLDPWSNPYRYSVSVRNTASGRSFTSVAGLAFEFSNGPLTTTDMLCVSDTAGCTGVTIADMVPAVVLSMGANWPTFTSTNETENAGGATDGIYSISNTVNFVDTTYAEETFDDMLIWLSPFILYNKLISAQKLP